MVVLQALACTYKSWGVVGVDAIRLDVPKELLKCTVSGSRMAILQGEAILVLTTMIRNNQTILFTS